MEQVSMARRAEEWTAVAPYRQEWGGPSPLRNCVSSRRSETETHAESWSDDSAEAPPHAGSATFAIVHQG